MALLAVLVAAATLGPPGVTVRPADAKPQSPVRIAASGPAGTHAAARLFGAQTGAGKPLPWVALARSGSGWRGVLRTPVYHGVYSVQLRVDGRTLGSPEWLVRVLPAGFDARPGAAGPEAAAAAWVRVGPPQARLTRLRLTSLGPRDLRFDRQYQVDFRLLAPWPPVHPQAGPLTMFVTVARRSLHDPWRWLDVGTGP